MKILFTGGGSGGHFYPIIAVAQELNKLIDDQKIVGVQLHYMSNDPYDARVLFENSITFSKVEAGKVRIYHSLLNVTDLFKTAFGSIRAIIKIFRLFPDVVFSKGGYPSVPVVLAARLFRIPILVHESDTVPGRANSWAGKFAAKVAIAFAEAAASFPKNKTALVGMPIRRDMLNPVRQGAHEFLHLDSAIPTIMITGGSLGAQLVNNAILDVLPRLVEKYQVIHQCGNANYDELRGRADVILRDNPNRSRYRLFDYLNESALRMSAGAADLAIIRAGATSIFETAQWGLPSIIIPITESNGDHQRKNAYSYARTGGGVVIEERNLTPNILYSEIDRILTRDADRERMKNAALHFATPDAAKIIAEELLAITLSHQ